MNSGALYKEHTRLAELERDKDMVAQQKAAGVELDDADQALKLASMEFSVQDRVDDILAGSTTREQWDRQKFETMRQKRMLNQVFTAIDIDLSGAISREEWKKIYNALDHSTTVKFGGVRRRSQFGKFLAAEPAHDLSWHKGPTAGVLLRNAQKHRFLPGCERSRCCRQITS